MGAGYFHAVMWCLFEYVPTGRIPKVLVVKGGIRIIYEQMMRVAETNLTDTSMCHTGLLPDRFSNRKT